MYLTFYAFTLGIVEVRYRWAMRHEDSKESINISDISVCFFSFLRFMEFALLDMLFNLIVHVPVHPDEDRRIKYD